MNTRIFEPEGIFISIVFSRNLDRTPAWYFIIENVEDELFKSCRMYNHRECEIHALKKAIDYLPENKQQ